MVDIFLSYAREDEAHAKDLAFTLEEYGWSVFWDQAIPVGQTWRNYIGQALSDARCVVVVWSQRSVNSDWVVEEADEGKRRQVLVPVLIDSVEQPLGFRQIQAADLTKWQRGHPSPHFDRLIEDIRKLMRSQATQSSDHLSVESNVVPPINTANVSRVKSRTPTKNTSHTILGMVAIVVAVIGYFVASKMIFQSPPETTALIPSQHPATPQSPQNQSTEDIENLDKEIRVAEIRLEQLTEKRKFLASTNRSSEDLDKEIAKLETTLKQLESKTQTLAGEGQRMSYDPSSDEKKKKIEELNKRIDAYLKSLRAL